MNVVSPISKTDLNRIPKIYADIGSKVKGQIYIRRALKEIGHYQPFFLLILNRYKMELDKESAKPLLKLYFLIWFFYKRKTRIRDIPVTSERYMHAEFEIADMEEDEQLFDALESPGSKALISVILSKFKQDPEFETLFQNSDSTIFISICSFIRCFDEITTKRWP